MYRNYRNKKSYLEIVDFKNALGAFFFNDYIKDYHFITMLNRMAVAINRIEHKNARAAMALIAVISNCGFSGYDGYIEEVYMPSTRDSMDSMRYARKILNRKAPLKVSFYDKKDEILYTYSLYL